MNILHAIHSVDPSGGGPVEVVKQLGAAHRAMGHRVEVVSLDAPDSPGVENFPLPLHTMRSRAKRGDYGFAPPLIPWLKKSLPDFDAVIVHGVWQFHSFAVQRVRRTTTAPYFVFSHGMLDPWFRRRYPLKHLKKMLYWTCIESRVVRDASAVLFTSDEERRLAHRDFEFSETRDVILPVGIAEPPADAERQQRAFFEKHPQLRGRRLLLFLGRLHEKKGCDLLLRSFAAQHSDLHLVIAGPCADEAYRRELLAIAAGADVTFTGELNGGEKWGALRAAEAFILPSHQENFGVAVVESLACGTPVLISDKVNIWREISAAGAALVEPDNLAGTSRLIGRWINLPSEKRAAMRAAARECFTRHFDIHRAAEQMMELIRVSSK